jgi:hypothetical protein
MILFNNWLTKEEMDFIQQTVNSPRWEFGHTSTGTPTNGYLWVINIDKSEDFYYKHLLDKIKKTTNEEFNVERVYLNGNQNSSCGSIHKDNINKNGKTFLIYCNPDWNIEIGGHTHFIENNHILSVPPIPGNAIYFDGTMDHFAAPLNPMYQGLRVTLAYKLIKQ